MKTRHKIPMVFSLSMVDVLCCALGCVILMWLLGAKEAVEANDQLREETTSRIAAMETESAEANGALTARVNALLLERSEAVRLEARLADRIRDLERVRDQMSTNLSSEQTKAKDLATRLNSSLARVGTLEAEVKSSMALLDEERRQAKATDKKLADSDAALRATRADLDSEKSKVTVAQTRLSALESDIDARKRELTGLNQSLQSAEARRKKLESALSVRDQELADTKRNYKKELDASEERENYLQKQLRERKSAMDDASRAIDMLKRQAAALRAEGDSRFAGISLTGKRVVFLVDFSASMEHVDATTKAPFKWEEVGKTVGRLMRSMPDLEKFQVICFARDASFLLGNDGKWFDFAIDKSPDEVVTALAKVVPKGGTNMYKALDLAFKYRADGMDTLYLLSDGLPNQGEGVSEQQRVRLKDNDFELGQLLGKHVRTMLKEDWNKPVRGKRVKINTIGFFYESPDLGSFLWALARENDGNFVGMSRP